VHAVAELGRELERRRAAGGAVQAQPRQLRVLGLRHQATDLAAPGDQRELRQQLCRRR
jgi:hypothetical protein